MKQEDGRFARGKDLEQSGPRAQGAGRFPPLLGEGILKGVDLLVSTTPHRGLKLTLVLSLWKPGISFQGPQSNRPCFHGDPTIPHQLPSCHNNPRDYQPLGSATLPNTSAPPPWVALAMEDGKLRHRKA